MQNRYSSFGSEPRLPSDMIRAILVSVDFKITSYTRFAVDLEENYLHAIIQTLLSAILPMLKLFTTHINAFDR